MHHVWIGVGTFLQHVPPPTAGTAPTDRVEAMGATDNLCLGMALVYSFFGGDFGRRAKALLGPRLAVLLVSAPHPRARAEWA